MSADDERYPPVNPGRFMRTVAVFRFLSNLWVKDIIIEGQEYIPMEGGAIYCVNHLSRLDSPLQTLSLPRHAHALAGEKYKRTLFRPILAVAGAIYINRGEVDRRALQQAIHVLEDGNLLAVAIEGTRSKSGELADGKAGVAYLATRANVPVIPGVCWGTERMMDDLKHLRRTPSIHIRVGPPIRFPKGRARGTQLEAYTEEIMVTLAAMLPERYRGRYADHPRLLEKLAVYGGK